MNLLNLILEEKRKREQEKGARQIPLQLELPEPQYLPEQQIEEDKPAIIVIEL